VAKCPSKFTTKGKETIGNKNFMIMGMFLQADWGEQNVCPVLLKARLKLKAPMSKHFTWSKQSSFNEA